MIKRHLFTPGPVPVPDRVRLAMAAPILHHRQADFLPLFATCRKGLQRIFQTEEPVLILASSGTGAMEASVSNLLSPGDHALVVRGGKFGERWAELCEAFGVRTTCIDVPWGDPVDPDEIGRALATEPDIRAVYLQASETSTASCHPVREVAEVVRRGDKERLVVVDGVTAIGVYDVPMDAWGLDVVISGSQKAFMLPPGLSFISLSQRARRFQESATNPRYYFDLAKELKSQPQDQTAYTPAVTLLVGLAEALRIILDEEGLEETWARTGLLAHATREAMTAMGLELLSPRAPSPACTAVYVPPGIEGPALRKVLRDELGVNVADGQGKLKGKIFRIAHLGFYDRFDAVTAVAAVELGLARLGWSGPRGRGVQRVTEVLADALEAR